jgi:Putative restriction endonuclease
VNKFATAFAEPPAVPPLEPGDHLDQKTFHERYLAMPPHIRAELIEGVVYMPSPLKAHHGRSHFELGTWLTRYKAHTPGTDVLDNATTILDDANEPQPDAALRLLPEHGGQTHENADGYIVGAPELTAEVALSSAAIDLHTQRRAYEQTGVREYIVLVLRENRVVWFVRRGAGFVSLDPGSDGILRSEFFGGLWMDPAAMLREDTLRVEEVLQLGLASSDHKAFVEKLRRP